MSAVNHGKVEWHCFNDCRMEGCPGHSAWLWSKHGAYYLHKMDNKEGDTEIYPDIALIDAISWTLWHDRGLVE